MIVMREIRRRARRRWSARCLGILLTGYFAYHLVEGDRGLRAWMRVDRRSCARQGQLAAVSAKRAALEHRVAHMRPDQVDPDLLDEQVRETLDLVAPDEIVIIAAADAR